MNIIAILYVIAAGAPFASGANLAPFAPFGARSVFAGAAVVFFAYVGFDSVATLAEEVGSHSCTPTYGQCHALAEPVHADQYGSGTEQLLNYIYDCNFAPPGALSPPQVVLQQSLLAVRRDAGKILCRRIGWVPGLAECVPG